MVRVEVAPLAPAGSLAGAGGMAVVVRGGMFPGVLLVPPTAPVAAAAGLVAET